jgi:hypothetical protein
MNWLSVVSIFAKPLGAVVNKVIAAGSSAVIGYAVGKGLPVAETTNIVAAVALALSTIISGFAASQGVQIPIINDDQNNDVKVVSAKSSSPAVYSPTLPVSNTDTAG